MSDLSVFENPITKNGIKYYVFPIDYPLFKANNTRAPTRFTPNIPSFFGIKKDDPEYIESYEEEYGIIHEFKTVIPYELVALDDADTQQTLYKDAPENIKKILKNNYGYGIVPIQRESVSEKDRELAYYLCSLGFQGYATNNMPTISGGMFHIEILICNAADGIEFVETRTNESKMKYLIEKAKMKQLGEEMKQKRKKSSKSRSWDDDDDEVRGSLFESPPKIRAIDSTAMSGFSTPPRSLASAFGTPSPAKNLAFGTPSPERKKLFDDDAWGGRKSKRHKTRRTRKAYKTKRRHSNKKKNKSKKYR